MDKVKFEKMAMPEPNTGCWFWTGSINPEGYGRVYSKTNNGFSMAHRLAYYLYKSDPSGRVVMHTCDQPSCVNPEHLILGTNADNTADRHGKKRDARGSGHGMSKLTESDVIEILTLYSSGEYGRSKIAKMFGVSAHAIYTIVNGKAWSHVQFDRQLIKGVLDFRKQNWKCNHSLQ